MFRNRFLGGVSQFALFAPDTGAGAGGGDGARANAGAADDGAGKGAGAGGGGAAAGDGDAAAAAGGAGKGGADAGAGSGAGPLAGGKGDPGKAADAAAAAAAAATAFPADWREKAAGEDKAFLNTLKRYGSPDDVFKALRGLQLQISAGELKASVKPPPENATAEQVAAWRKDQGLPEKAADYVTNLKLANGVVPGEADKPLLNAVAEMAQKGNYPQQTVNDFVGMYYTLQDQMAGQRAEADQDLRITSQQQLIEQMGPDFKRNMIGLQSFWSEQPQGMAELVLGARTPDGKVIGDLPEVTSWITNLMRELNPAATILPPNTDGSPASIGNRMKEIESKMYVDGKPNPEYFGTKMEAEYRDLIDAQERMSKRSAA